MLTAVAAFLCGFVYDFFWTKTVECVQHKREFAAANLGIILYCCTLMSTVLVVEKCVLAVIAFGIGNWFGVYLAVKRKR
jgi:DNA-directed RNA polymerase subunit N (RpoN/RPB10)